MLWIYLSDMAVINQFRIILFNLITGINITQSVISLLIGFVRQIYR